MYPSFHCRSSVFSNTNIKFFWRNWWKTKSHLTSGVTTDRSVLSDLYFYFLAWGTVPSHWVEQVLSWSQSRAQWQNPLLFCCLVAVKLELMFFDKMPVPVGASRCSRPLKTHSIIALMQWAVSSAFLAVYFCNTMVWWITNFPCYLLSSEAFLCLAITTRSDRTSWGSSPMKCYLWGIAGVSVLDLNYMACLIQQGRIPHHLPWPGSRIIFTCPCCHKDHVIILMSNLFNNPSWPWPSCCQASCSLTFE